MSLARLEELVCTFPGEMGVYAKDLNSNAVIAINADTPFYLASVAKTLIMIGAVDAMASASELDQRQKIELSDYREEGKRFRYHHIGSEQTYRRVIERMIANSDTTATDMVVRIAGLDNINQTIRDLNIPGLSEVTSIGELDRIVRANRNDAWAAVPPWAFEPYTRNGIRDFLIPAFFPNEPPGDDATTPQEAYGDYYAMHLNTATPRAMGQVAERLANDALLDEGWKNSELGDKLFLAGREGILGGAVPGTREVDTKGGAKYRVRCELGVVYDSARSNPDAVIGIFTQKLLIPDGRVRPIIRAAANLAYQALGKSHTLPAPTPANPGLVFLDPPAGRLFEPGTTPTIRWQSQGLGGPLRLELLRFDRQRGDDELVQTISGNVVNDGEWHSWTVPSNFRASTNYRLRLTSNQSPNIQAYSHFFALRGIIRVLEPHLAENHVAGSYPEIRWSAFGVSGTLKIELYKGAVLVRLLEARTSNDGVFSSWKVDENLTSDNDYRVRIASNEDSGVVGWSPFFTIGGRIEVDAPGLGDAIAIGERPTLRWRTEHVQGNLRLELWRGEATLVRVISGAAHDDGEWHSWTVPGNIADGEGYRIRVSSSSASGIQGFSHYFQLGARLEWLVPSIEQATFVGGPHARPHFFRYGDTPTLRWRTIGALQGGVRLELLHNGHPVKTIGTDNANDGEWHSWTVTEQFSRSSRYRLRLTSVERERVVALSHHFFIGALVDIALPCDPSTGTAQTVVKRGETPQIRWRTENVIGNLRLELYRRNAHIDTLGANARNDGEWHSWTVPINLEPGDGYRFKLSSRQRPNLSGFSPWFAVED